MAPSIAVARGLILTLLASLEGVRRVSGPLRAQLGELWGDREPSEFWTAFSDVALVLTSCVFAMLVEPKTEPAVPVVLAVGNPLRWGLIGLVFKVLTAGWVPGRFIPRVPVGRSPALGRKQGGGI